MADDLRVSLLDDLDDDVDGVDSVVHLSGIGDPPVNKPSNFCQRWFTYLVKPVYCWFGRVPSSGESSQNIPSSNNQSYTSLNRHQTSIDRGLERGSLDGASTGSSPHTSVSGSPRLGRRSDHVNIPASLPKSRSQDFPSGHRRPIYHDGASSERSLPGTEAESAPHVFSGHSVAEEASNAELWESLSEEHGELANDVKGTKDMLLNLQELLLHGTPPDGAEADTSMREVGRNDEQIVILKSRLQQSEASCDNLREELSRARSEAMELQATKAGLQSRLAEQEEALLKMKAELLRIGFAQQSLETKNIELEHQLKAKDQNIFELKREQSRIDQQHEEFIAEIQYHEQEKENTARILRSQILDLHEKLKNVGEKESTLSQRVASQDRKMAHLEGRILNSKQDNSRPSSSRSHRSTGSEDIQLQMRDSLQSLRSGFHEDNSKQHAVDMLERSINSLMERLQTSEVSRIGSDIPSQNHLNYDSTGDIRRSPITSLQGLPSRLDHSSSSTSSATSQTTKVLYFTNRTVTPFMCTIHKRLGEITLRDIKALVDRPGNYRFHFKAMDPEFGTVKEEVSLNDAVIPGWEGKIVAWIEEDHA